MCTCSLVLLVLAVHRSSFPPSTPTSHFIAVHCYSGRDLISPKRNHLAEIFNCRKYIAAFPPLIHYMCSRILCLPWHGPQKNRISSESWWVRNIHRCVPERNNERTNERKKERKKSGWMPRKMGSMGHCRRRRCRSRRSSSLLNRMGLGCAVQPWEWWWWWWGIIESCLKM